MNPLLTIYFYFNKIFRSNSCDFYKIKSWLFTLGVITLGTAISWGQGNEDFTNIPTNNSGQYLSRYWIGTDGETWTAENARTDQTLNGRAICTRDPGKVTSPTYSGGMGTLTFNYVRGFTGTGERGIEVYVNGIQIGANIIVNSTSDVVVGYSSAINISGNVQLELRTSGAQIKIDDISWTAFPTCTAPTTQSTSANFSAITNNSMNLSWTSGNGNGRIVVMKEASAVSGTPTSGTTYTANAAFGSGSTIATNEFVVYNGTGNSVSVSGLACGKTYHVKVYEYNTTDVCYNTTSPASTSAATLITASPTAPSFTQTCGSTTFAAIPNTATENTFWQTSASGTSETDPADVTKTVSSATTIYLRTKSSTGCWSNATTVSPAIISSPSITSQPVDQNGTDGGSATFSVVANNATGYQWQISTNGGTTWNNISGETNPSLSVSSLTLAMNGYKYRAIITAASPCVDVVTNAANLSVVTGPCAQIDFNSAGLNGWTVSSSSLIASGQSCDGNGYVLSASGQYVISPLVSNPQTLTFVNKRSNNSTPWKINIDFSTSVSGPWTSLTSSTQISTDCETRTFDLSSINDDVYIRIIDDRSSGANQRTIDDIQIFCAPPTPTCTPTATITSFLPNSGPAGTIITITGSGFTGTTDVKFGTVDATSFTIIDDNTITAEVPAGIGNSETISVFDASACEEVSVDTYSLTTLSGACSAYPGYTDLFMSEVYDHSPGDGWYLELYNPTSSPVVLTGVYQIEKYGELNLTGSYNLIDLVGTVPPMSVFVIQLHSVNRCTGLAVDFQTPGDWGINENDRIRLVKNGTVVDDVSTPNYKGYTIVRDISPSGVAPSDVYPTVGWTTSSAFDCSDLGFFTLPPSTNIDVTSPTDVSGCSLNMSVTSTTPGVTYSWKFNDPTTNTWLAVNSTNLPGVTITGETTSNLSITGDLAFMEDFQFYCEVSESGCSSASDAAQFNTDSRPIYRSVAGSNGVWSDYTNWEMSYDYITYVPACAYPTASNSSKVFIENGTTIELDIDNDVDYLEIKNGGTLEVLPSSKLTVNDSTVGADFIINGTFLYRSNSSNSFSFGTNATWSLGSNATLIKTNTGGIATFRDNYEGGIPNIPATAQWIYRYNDDGNPIIVTVNMYYPNLRFENTTSTPYITNTLASFTGNTSTAIIKGDLEIGTTGTSTYKLHNNNNHSNPIRIMGNLSIGAGSELTNSALDINEGTGVELYGNLTVDGSLNLISGTTERVLKLMETTDQVIAGTGIINIYKIEINKISGNVFLNRNLQAQNELKMSNGHIYTNSNTLELGLDTSQKGILTYTNGYVIGKMKRWFNGTNTGNTSSLFPMGIHDGSLRNRFAKIEYTTAPTAGGDLTVEFIGLDMTYAGLIIPAGNSGGFGSDITNAEDQGYWTCTAGSLSGGTYTSSYTGEGFSQIISLLDITLLKRQNASSPWTAPGVHIPAAGTTGLPTVSRSGLTGFSDFGFGSRNNENPLPIELISFSAVCNNEKEGLIQWKTATETNNDYFTIEKSTDGIEWHFVEKIKGKGNYSLQSNYSIKDRDINNEVTYYRLTQVDFNGDTETFHPISLICQTSTFYFQVFPNPANDFTTVSLQGYNFQNATLDLRTIEGKLIQRNLVFENTNSIHLNVNLNSLSQGIYLLHWTDGNGEKEVRKIVVK